MRVADRPVRTPEHWDARAADMNSTVFEGAYLRGFLARMNLDDCATLLDVGCGPGTIGLSVAPRLDHVYALDYSPGMLAVLSENALARGLTNVTPILLGWDDDWAPVPVCDVVVASRSLVVPDLEAAILRLQSKARRRVFATYPADGTMLPTSLLRALGREQNAAPDWLCALGVLHDLGIYPTLDFLPGKNRISGCATFEAMWAKVGDVLGELGPEKRQHVEAFWETNHERLRGEMLRWALFSWEIR